jgi:ATP-dependent DNA ligase
MVEYICDTDSNSFSKITTSYGIENSKLTISENIISEGKNIGKSNNTSHFEQAVLEATSKWTKKNKSITTTILPLLKTDTLNNETVPTYNVIFPMLAHDFHKHKNKITFPVYIQPKLDGNRCIWNYGKLYSRTGKEWDSLNNSISPTLIFKELSNEVFKDIILDGELYIHNSKFEDLGVLRKKKLSLADIKTLNNIEYHIYDIVDINLSFSKRLLLLENIFKHNSFSNLKLVNTFSANSFDDISNLHYSFIKDNYEGTMVRTRDSFYKLNTRSYDLLKYKDFVDSEFVIVDYTSESNHHSALQNLVIWICKTSSGELFNVRPQGNSDERHYLYNNASKYIGSNLWCKYFELSSDNKIPRFPSTKTNSYKTYIRNIID